SSLKFGHRGGSSDTPGSNVPGGFYLNGLVDEPAVYARALSDTEIQTIFNLGGFPQAGNTVEGNFIGTNAAGSAKVANGTQGVLIQSGATNNRVGTDGDGVNDAAERNVISGNTSVGVLIQSAGTNN